MLKQEEETKEETDGDAKEQQNEEDKKNREDSCRKRKTNWASLSLEAIQCNMPAKSYTLYLRKQWL